MRSDKKGKGINWAWGGINTQIISWAIKQVSVNKFKMNDHSSIKLENKDRKRSAKATNIWKLNNELLNRICKSFKLNEDENTTCQNRGVQLKQRLEGHV